MTVLNVTNSEVKPIQQPGAVCLAAFYCPEHGQGPCKDNICHLAEWILQLISFLLKLGNLGAICQVIKILVLHMNNLNGTCHLFLILPFPFPKEDGRGRLCCCDEMLCQVSGDVEVASSPGSSWYPAGLVGRVQGLTDRCGSHPGCFTGLFGIPEGKITAI